MALAPKTIAIIGGGPIGLFHAIQMARQGYQVELFEKRSWPIDKVCGQGIMPSGVSLLQEIGFEFDSENSAEFNGIKYIDGNSTLEGHLEKSGQGVKRTKLSWQLFQIASRYQNIALFSHSLVEKIERLNSQYKINGSDKLYDFIFICDGLLSPTRKKLGFTKTRNSNLRMGARIHIKSHHQFQQVQVLWKDGIEAYITPVSKSEFEIAFLWFQKEHQIKKELSLFLQDKFPELKEYFFQAENDLKAYGPFNQYSSHLYDKNIFFLGDAYCFIDGVTGEGLSIGFRASEILSKHLEKKKFLGLIKIKLIYWKYIVITNLALTLARFPKWRKLVFKLFKKNNLMFDLVLELNDH